MGKRFFFTEEVLAKDLTDTKETLAYLKEKRNELIAVSECDLEIQRNNLENQELLSYFTWLIPGIRMMQADFSFFHSLSRPLQFNYQCHSNDFGPEPLELGGLGRKERIACIFVSDQFDLCQRAMYESIYYDDGTHNFVGGRKVKQLSQMKYMF